MDNFSFTPFPQIYFGDGEFLRLVQKLSGTTEVLIIVGGESLKKSGMLKQFIDELDKSGIHSSVVSIDSEPSTQIIDSVTGKYRPQNIQKVIAIGGGSVLDAGKAIAAMLPLSDGIINYLEGVGTKSHPGSTVSFIAVPTTAGTGSEATKNAVISSIGESGFKKSLRHDNFIPDIAVIDPQLMLSCPETLTAACGLDAITQLLESYVSSKSNPITDALAFDALTKAIPAFEVAVKDGHKNLEARASMAYGALISGITLANAGLGIVHGFASPIGGFFDIPHGVVCGTLLAVATEINIKRLKESRLLEHKERLEKHLRVARILPESKDLSDNEALACLSAKFNQWIEDFKIPRLGEYGISENDLDRIIAASGLKNNPVSLSNIELKEILQKRL